MTSCPLSNRTTQFTTNVCNSRNPSQLFVMNDIFTNQRHARAPHTSTLTFSQAHPAAHPHPALSELFFAVGIMLSLTQLLDLFIPSLLFTCGSVTCGCLCILWITHPLHKPVSSLLCSKFSCK